MTHSRGNPSPSLGPRWWRGRVHPAEGLGSVSTDPCHVSKEILVSSTSSPINACGPRAADGQCFFSLSLSFFYCTHHVIAGICRRGQNWGLQIEPLKNLSFLPGSDISFLPMTATKLEPVKVLLFCQGHGDAEQKQTGEPHQSPSHGDDDLGAREVRALN